MNKENKDIELLPVDFDPFAGSEILKIAPTIEPQLEIWASCMIGGDDANRAYNESVSLLLTGTFQLDALNKALADLIARHEGLRASFSSDGTQICIFRELPVNLQYEDLSIETASVQQQHIEDYAKLDRERAFDLINGPLFRFTLFRLNDKEHYLTITAHHIICDGWSLGILMQDLSALYSAHAKNEIAVLPEVYRFSDYAVDYWEFTKTEEYKKIEQYWIDQYKDNVPILNVPTDFPRPSVRTFKSQRDDFAIEPELVNAIKKIGAKAGCSFVTTLLSAFEVFLNRITGQTDIVLGLPAAGQSATGHHALIGHCVHLLPLRSFPEGEISFNDYLRQRKSKILSDYDHQQFTFGSLLKKLNVSRDPSRIPLVPIAFNIDMGLDKGVVFHDLKHKLVYNPRAFENFEIFLNATGSEQMLVLEWSYNTRLFSSFTIRRMMDQFETLLQTIVRNPQVKIKDILVGSPFDITPTSKPDDFPRDKTIVDLFISQARKSPNEIAIVFEDQKITYRDLDEKSNQLAHFLIGKGVVTETLVPICMERSIELLIGILGILKAGGAYVPLDPEYPADRIDFMLKDTSSKLIVTNKSCRQKMGSKKSQELILLDDQWEKIGQEQVYPTGSNIDPSNLAYIIYTSGSTGRPKGTMIEHRNVVSLVKGVDYVNFSSDEVLISTGSPSFDATTYDYWGMLLNGGLLVICSEQTLLNGRLLKKEIDNRNVSQLFFTTGLFNQWVDLEINIFENLETVLTGGEKISERHISKLRKTFPSLNIVHVYGPTENTTFSLSYKINSQEISSAIPIGHALNNRTAYVLNQDQQICPVGVVGELYVGGAGVARGYLNLPEISAEKFLPDPFSRDPLAKMYRTGDLARAMSDGNIEFIGRVDDQVKIRGFRVELGEIENVLQQCAGVAHAVVIAREDKEGGKRLIAYIVPEGEFNKESIANFLQSKLPAYMIPRVLMELNRIPLTANGKVDKKALPDPDLIPDTGKKKNRAPLTEGQALVASVWAEALGLEQVSIDDDFFELGGHSLIAIKVMKKLEEKTGQRLPITALFEAPTVEKLSLMLHLDKKAISWKSLVPIKPNGSKPPLYIVHGSGLTVLIFSALAKGMDPDQPVFGLQARGLNGEDPLDTIEDIASCYISEILDQNPDGPYCLAGYSLGGIVAFEMAKQLTAMGKEISMLAIFDTNADNSDALMPTSTRLKKKVIRQFPKMLFILRSLGNHPWQTIQYQWKFAMNKLRYLFERAGLVDRLKTEEEELSEYANQIHEKHYKAFFSYKMTPFNGVLHLFRVKKRLYFLDDPEWLGWKPFALKGVKIHEIPGDHKTFLLPPNDKELAKILRNTINECIGTKDMVNDFSHKSSVLRRV
ncbi:MAG: non-ribosomal peptide synthetase [Bacteroidetes bacterium]|nr:MAG: non-ribosomal peptide synthetase [Bacteroidota bacterium]